MIAQWFNTVWIVPGMAPACDWKHGVPPLPVLL